MWTRMPSMSARIHPEILATMGRARQAELIATSSNYMRLIQPSASCPAPPRKRYCRKWRTTSWRKASWWAHSANDDIEFNKFNGPTCKTIRQPCHSRRPRHIHLGGEKRAESDE